MPRHDKDEGTEYYDDDEHKLEAPADFDGPVSDRHCTDILLLLLLFAMWIAMTAVGGYAIANGDYRRVVYPLDFDGNICGTDLGVVDMTNFPVLLYINNWGGGVCVNHCPSVSDATNGANKTDIYTLFTYDGTLFQVNGSILDPDTFVQIGNYSNSSDALSCSMDMCYPDNDPAKSWVSPGVDKGWGYSYYAGDTYEVLWRCTYTIDATREIQELVSADPGDSLDPTDDAYAFFNKLYADCYVARWYILGFGLGFCTVVALTYIFLMRLPFLLRTVVWTSILLTICLFFIAGYYTYATAQDWDDEDPKTISDTTILATQVASYILFALGGCLFVLAICLRQQIAIAIGCVKTAGKAVNHMFLILGVPVLQAIGLFCFVLIWLYYAVYLASIGEITTTDHSVDFSGTQVAVREFTWDDYVIRAGWYLLFCLFWTANFVVAMGDMIVALAVAKYYFTRDKWRIGSWTVISSTQQVIWYHAGTCAYGALLIAIVQIIRAAIAKAQRAVKNAGDNKLIQCVLCCCQCCFCCLEKCLRFISKNAYIQTAIFSTAFCKSCRKAFFLITRNMARVAAISFVSGAVLIIGKLFISALTTLAAYYFMVEDINDELHSIAGPTVVIFLLSYWVSDFFMDVFDMAITTILHCFIADEEMFTDQVYADADLKKYIDDHGAEKD